MLTRHANELSLRLERVYDVGCMEVSGNELRRWYGQDRLSKTVWRDIKDRWEEIDAEAPLLVGISRDTYVFVYGNGLVIDKAQSKDVWLADLNDWL
jgi:hypothetical protein